jgi:hypothetical protein
MRDINIKKDGSSVLKVVSIIVLAGAALLVLAALGVGFVAWRLMKPPEPSSAPSPVAAQWQPGQRPPGVPGGFARQPPTPGGPLQSLPTPPAVETKRPPPQPSRKQMDITAVRSFRAHSGSLFAVAVSPDGHRAISGGNDKALRLWDLDNGKQLATLEGHTDSVRAVAFAPDGKRAISASQDGSLRLWDLTEKKSIRVFKGHDGTVFCAAFTPDGKLLLSGGTDRSLRVWDVESGKQLQQWYGHDADILCISVSPDGETALTGSADGGATHWDLRSGRELAYVSVGNPVYFALFTPDGKRAIVGGDAPARLCDLSTGEQWPELPPSGGMLRGAALLSGDLVFLQSAGKRLEFRFLETCHLDPSNRADRRWNLLGEIEAHEHAITCVCTSRDGRLALTAGEDGSIKLWRISERPGNKE